MKLRDYQVECYKEMKFVKEGERKLVVIATGGGKTVCFATLAADAKGRVLITVPSTELREQTEEKLRAINPGLDIGHVQASIDDVHSKIVISTRQSLTHKKSTRVKRMLDHGDFEYHILDEVHQAPEQLKKVMDGVNANVKTIGFTATPYSTACIDTFGQPIYRKSIIELIDEGYLVEPYSILVKSKTNISHVKTTKGDFASGELEEVVNNAERNQLIVEAYKKYAADRELTLVFAAGRDHGKELLELFKENGISVEYIDGETAKEQRKEIIHRYKDKKTKVLINVMALTTGFDVPSTDTILICRPTKSRILFEQIVGRGLRLAEGKTDCMIIDIQDVTKKHDLMDIGAVFNTPMRSGERLGQAKKRVEEEEVLAAIKKAEDERRRLEYEEAKAMELEIVAQKIKLINRNMKLGFQDRTYDWFRCDNVSYALSYAANNHLVVEGINEEFALYDVSTDKTNKYIDLIRTFENLQDAVTFAEKQTKKNTYSDPKSPWKSDPPTESQLRYASWCKTKWEVNKYFTSSTISTMLSKHRSKGTGG